MLLKLGNTYNVVKAGKFILSSIAYQNANVRPWGASENCKCLYPSAISLLEIHLQCVKKMNKGKYTRLLIATLLIILVKNFINSTSMQVIKY